MKKFLKKNIIIKMVAIVLVAATVMGIAWNESFVKSRASGKARTENVVTSSEDDDEEVEIPQYSEEDIEDFEVVELSNGEMQTTVKYKDGTKMVTISSEFLMTTIYYDANENIIKEECTDLSEVLDDDISDEELEKEEDDDYDSDVKFEDGNNGVTRSGKKKFNKTMKETYRENYWYRKGSDDTTVYYRIGCKAKYEIKVNKKTKKACEAYATAIKDCRNKMKTAKTILVSAGVALFILNLCVSLAKAGVVVVKKMVAKILNVKAVAALGLSAASIAAVERCAGSVIGASRIYEDIKDLYVDARVLGRKYK